MGKIVSTTGDLLDAAIQQAEKMAQRGQEIQRIGRDMAIENMERIDEYKSDLHDNYLTGVKNWRDSLQQEVDYQQLQKQHPPLILKEGYYHVPVDDVD